MNRHFLGDLLGSFQIFDYNKHPISRSSNYFFFLSNYFLIQNSYEHMFYYSEGRLLPFQVSAWGPPLQKPSPPRPAAGGGTALGSPQGSPTIIAAGASLPVKSLSLSLTLETQLGKGLYSVPCSGPGAKHGAWLVRAIASPAE